MKSKFCKEGYLTDKEFLEHMIPHHQMAINMSHLLLKTTRNPFMTILARDIAYLQSYEVWLMKMHLTNGLPNTGQNMKRFSRWKPELKMECYYPDMSRDKNAVCDEMFFSTDVHSTHNKQITDEEYIHHMIPHHQIAVDMSNQILKYTRNPFMQEFAYKIIKGQQYEIWKMKSYLRNNKALSYTSELLQ